VISDPKAPGITKFSQAVLLPLPPNRCVCIAYSCGYLGRLVSTLAHRLNQKVGRAPDLQETHLRHTRKESPIARLLSVRGTGLN
jgi:hypothetical protein